jgi:hypothetical protein
VETGVRERERRTTGRPGALATRLPDRIWVPAVAALLLAVGFVGALLVRADGDVSLLVHAAPPWTDPDLAPRSLTVQDPDDGFDGQFFYRLGVSPWTTDEVVAGVTNDLPSLRNARWGYGALAWVASGGQTDLVPWALVGLNVAAMTAIGAIGGGLARSFGRHAGWGLLLALWPGFAYSLSLDTSELVASTFLLGGLLAIRHHRWIPSAALLTAAVLTRDTTAVVPAGLALAGAWTWWSVRAHGPPSTTAPRTPAAGPDHEVDGIGGDGIGGDGIGVDGVEVDGAGGREAHRPSAAPDDGRPPTGFGLLVAGVVPLVAFVAWQVIQRARFGELPLTSSGDNNLSFPLAGLVDQLGQALPPSGGDDLFRLVCIVGLVLLFGAAGWVLADGRTAPATGVRLALRRASWTTWILAVAVVLVLNAYLWSGATAFMRAATEAGLLSTLVLLGGRGRHADRLLTLAGIGLGALWLLTAGAQLAKLG